MRSRAKMPNRSSQFQDCKGRRFRPLSQSVPLPLKKIARGRIVIVVVKTIFASMRFGRIVIAKTLTARHKHHTQYRKYSKTCPPTHSRYSHRRWRKAKKASFYTFRHAMKDCFAADKILPQSFNLSIVRGPDESCDP